jgi:hypothetical protein
LPLLCLEKPMKKLGENRVGETRAYVNSNGNLNWHEKSTSKNPEESLGELETREDNMASSESTDNIQHAS